MSSVKVEVAALGSPSLIARTVSVDEKSKIEQRVQRNCVEIEVAVLGSI